MRSSEQDKGKMPTKNKKVNLKRSHKEYAALNIQTHKFVDYDGNESHYDYVSFHNTIGPQEIIDELKVLSKRNSKKAQIVKKNLKKQNIG